MWGNSSRAADGGSVFYCLRFIVSAKEELSNRCPAKILVG